MAMASSEWGDIPSSSELFGGELFGDELMEMYGSSGVGHETDHEIPSLLVDSTTGNNNMNPIKKEDVAPPTAVKLETEEGKHPGVLVAMNAAAIDSGLRPASTEFSPMPGAPAVRAPAMAPVARPVARAAPVAAAFSGPLAPVAAPAPGMPQIPGVAAAVTKRPAAIGVPHSMGESPSKKRKASVPPRPKLVATGGISAPAIAKSRAVSAPAPALPVKLSAPRPSSIPSYLPPNVAILASTASSLTGQSAVITPTPKMPSVAGINYQVKPKAPMVPSAVMSSAALKKGAPLTAIAKTGATLVKPVHQQVGVDQINSTKRHTEADFKDVAHAAVSTLIQNATNGFTTIVKPVVPVKVSSPKQNGVEKINTSTAHVNALTSQNWVTACNPIPPPPEPSACDKAARNARRATLTQDERAKQNRDRNREHARNTRLRKKAYVEELKRTLTEIVAQRDANELEKRHSAQREREQREVRFRVMEEFLKLRGRNEHNAARWIAILEDGFTLTLPRTPFRETVDSSPSRNLPEDPANSGRILSSDLEQTLRGASAAMEDSQLLSKFLQSIGHGVANSPPIQLVYRCDRKRFFMDANITFMDFAASTVGAKNKGAESEIVFKGSMRSSFSPASNKLISVDISFDTGSIAYQLEHFGVSHTSQEAPNAAAAAAAAHEADALLDSLQMPQIYADQNPAEPVSVSSDDGERSYDERI